MSSPAAPRSCRDWHLLGLHPSNLSQSVPPCCNRNAGGRLGERRSAMAGPHRRRLFDAVAGENRRRRLAPARHLIPRRPELAVRPRFATAGPIQGAPNGYSRRDRINFGRFHDVRASIPADPAGRDACSVSHRPFPHRGGGDRRLARRLCPRPLPRRQVFAGFASPVVITVVEILLVVQVLARTRLFDRLSGTLAAARLSNSGIIAILSAATGFISIFMNNIGAFSIALPVALARSAPSWEFEAATGHADFLCRPSRWSRVADRNAGEPARQRCPRRRPEPALISSISPMSACRSQFPASR
jgi:hypothetical protein